LHYSEWKVWYAEIAEALQLSEAEDQSATDRLSHILNRASTIDDLKDLSNQRPAIVFGAGPSLETDVKEAMEQNALLNALTICADGATSAFLRTTGRAPNIIVSDLDGDLGDIVYANRKGATILVHAHGDNVPAVNEYAPLFVRPLLGTTQVEERTNVYNFGGFTDGDRAAFAAEAQGANPIILAGMDLGTLVGRYSKPGLSGPVQASGRKLMKLGFAKRLLEWLAEHGSADMANCTRSGEDLKGIPRVDWRNVGRIIR
jgi:2-amino-4-hydroxy-6-hydroxymethyldihydropteridine diphosphokinase